MIRKHAMMFFCRANLSVSYVTSEIIPSVMNRLRRISIETGFEINLILNLKVVAKRLLRVLIKIIKVNIAICKTSEADLVTILSLISGMN